MSVVRIAGRVVARAGAAVCAVGLLTGCSLLGFGGGDAASSAPTPTAAAPEPAAGTPTPTPDAAPLTWPQVFELTSSGVARVAVTTCAGGGSGSGFLVGPDTVMTAAHVVEGATSVSLRFGAAVFAGKPVLVDPATDVALVLVEGLPTAHEFDIAPESAAVGTDVAALGYPRGQPLGMTQGSVTSIDLRVAVEGQDYEGMFRTDSAINPGNSGGPVVDEQGRVVGIVSAGSSDAGAGYAVSQPAIQQAVDLVRSGGAATTPAEVCETNGEEPYSDPVTVTVSSSNPEAPSIAQTFQLYAQSINDRYDEQTWSLLTPSMQERVGGFEHYFQELSTSSWLSLDVRGVEAVDSVTDRATVAFRTTQDPAYGPDGSPCTDWVVTYTLVLDAGYWQIDGALLADGTEPVACTVEGDV